MKRKRKSLTLRQVQVNADPRDYYLQWFSDIPDDCNTGVVGIISNYSNLEIRIQLEISDEWMQANRKRGLALYLDPDGERVNAGIIMTKAEFDQLYREGKGISDIWHEVGHFHTTKYFLEYLTGEQEKLRGEYIGKGQIPPAEYVADLFALYYAERNDVFDNFKKLIRGRHELIGIDDNARAGWNELRMRRDALKKIETDEQIEAELCRVCGVGSIEEL